MKQYDDLFTYSNFDSIYKDKVIFYKYADGVLASVWMHLDAMTPIQYSKTYPASEWDSIKVWSRDKAYALCCEDETRYYAFVMGLALTFWAEADVWTGEDFWRIYKTAQKDFEDSMKRRQ